MVDLDELRTRAQAVLDAPDGVSLFKARMALLQTAFVTDLLELTARAEKAERDLRLLRQELGPQNADATISDWSDLKARAEAAERLLETVDRNATVQATLLADTGRRAEAAEARVTELEAEQQHSLSVVAESYARAEAAEAALVALRMAVAGPGSDRASVAKMWHGQLMEMARALHDGIAGGQSYIAALKAENERLRDALVEFDAEIESLRAQLATEHALGFKAGIEAGAESAASWRNPAAIKLIAGEMTAQELRTAQAVAGGIEMAITSLPTPPLMLPEILEMMRPFAHAALNSVLAKRAKMKVTE